MEQLKNWDNKTWLSSTQYISSFNNFLKSNTEISKDSKILDVGCGRANIISYLHKQYKFNNKHIIKTEQKKYLQNIYTNSIGFAGAKIIRRIFGFAHNIEFDWIRKEILKKELFFQFF